MINKHMIVDPSPGTGVFLGDLRYGRCNGDKPIHGRDFAGAENALVAPLTLVRPRDRSVWTHDPRVKKAKSKVVKSQHFDNELITAFIANQKNLRCNMRLTVGNQRL